MKLMAISIFCLLLVCACGDDSGAENRRFVDQDRLDNPIVPLDAVDSAVQTEAMTHMNKIAQQVKLTVAKGANKQTLYRAISGKLSASKLTKIGMSAAQLKGNYYVAGDYTLKFIGNKLTISAAQKGTRGRVDPQTFPVP